MRTKELIYCLLLILPVLFLVGSGTMSEATEGKAEGITVSPCPTETDHNKRIINDFITSPDWQQGRQETGTDHLTAAQITLLQASEYTSACETFNDKFQESLTATWPDGDLKNALSYYMVGNYFIVIETPHQPDEPNAFVTGESYIYIFDSTFNYIKGYFY